MGDTWFQDIDANRTPNGALRQIAAASPHLEDELLAERIELALEPCGDGDWPLKLSEIINAVPLLRSRPISLDAAIDVAVRCMLSGGLPAAEAEQRLIADSPEFCEAIAAHMALRSAMSTSRPERFRPEESHVGSLPAPFGPSLPDGRQRYELVEYVGGGSDGLVFRAYDRRVSADGRPLVVAVKLLHESDQAASERVSDEAARVMRMRHPVITSLLDWGQADQRAFLVYAFAEGTSLNNWRRTQGAPDSRVAADIVRRVAEGVQAAHNAGIVHRDLKPNNIVMDHQGRPSITDFGLAEAISPSRSGMFGGSLGFAAPEQLRGDPGGADTAVDVYALGGILYWLLAGVYPNGGTAQDAQRHALSPATPLEFEQRDVSVHDRTLQQVCLKALASNPGDRYSSASLLAEDLSRWQSREPVLPFEHSSHRRVVLAVQRSPVTALAAAGVVLALFAVLWSVWRIGVNEEQAAFALERERLQSDLEIKQTQVEADSRRFAEARALTQNLAESARRYLGSANDTSWLPMFSALESLADQGVLGMPGVGEELIQGRIRLVSDILEEADGDGRRDSVEMAMWETALVYWLIRGDRLTEARALAEINSTRMSKLISGDDPWALLAHGLHRVVILRTEPESDNATEAREWLASQRDRLPAAVVELVNPSGDTTFSSMRAERTEK